jgi:hypothetical protein
VGFFHWPGLDPALAGTETEAVVHVSDWLPTFVSGVAGLPLSRDGFAYGLDGVDQWAALTGGPGQQPARGDAAGTGGIVHEIGGDNHIRQESYFDGRQYKLIRFHPTIYGNGPSAGACKPLNCPCGWSPLQGTGDPTAAPASENDTNRFGGGGGVFAPRTLTRQATMAARTRVTPPSPLPFIAQPANR